MRRWSPRAVDWLVTAALALTTVVWLLAVEGREGIGRDEGQYMRAGERYWGWFEEAAVNLSHGKLKQSFTGDGIGADDSRASSCALQNSPLPSRRGQAREPSLTERREGAGAPCGGCRR